MFRCTCHMGKPAFPSTSGGYNDLDESDTDGEETTSDEESEEVNFVPNHKLRKAYRKSFEKGNRKTSAKTGLRKTEMAPFQPPTLRKTPSAPTQRKKKTPGVPMKGQNKTTSVPMTRQNKTPSVPTTRQNKTPGVPTQSSSKTFRAPSAKVKIPTAPTEATISSDDFSDPNFNYSKPKSIKQKTARKVPKSSQSSQSSVESGSKPNVQSHKAAFVI